MAGRLLRTLGDRIDAAMRGNVERAHGQEDDGPDTLLPPLLGLLVERAEAGEVSVLLSRLSAPDIGDLSQLRAVTGAAADWVHDRIGHPDSADDAREVWHQLTAAQDALEHAQLALGQAAATIAWSLPDTPAPTVLRGRTALTRSSTGLGLDRSTPARPAASGRPPLPRPAAPSSRRL